MNFTGRKVYFVVGFIVVAFITGAVGFFIQSVTQYMIDESKNSLTEIASKSALVQESSIAARLDTLSSLANLKVIKDTEIPLEEKLDIIRQEANRNNFIRIGVTDANGNAQTSDGYQFFIGDRDYFLKSMHGEKILSNKLSDRIGVVNQDIIVYSVPIYDGEKIIGIIFATGEVAHIFAFIYDVNIDFCQNMLIVSKEGKVFAKKEQGRLETISNEGNFLQSVKVYTANDEYKNIVNLITENRIGGALCTIEGQEFVLGVHTLANTDGWNIVVLAPKDQMMKSTSYIVKFSLILIFGLIFFIVLAFLFVYLLNKKYLMEKHNSKLAAEKLKIKDSFIANVSHEIRTPLNAINGITYFLKSTNLSDMQKKQLQKIESATEVLLGIINDILDISKITQGKLKLENKPFALINVITSLDYIFSDKIRNKGLEWNIEKNFDEDIWVWGDKYRLNQIIINLVNNAYKFTNQGRIYLRIKQLAATKKVVEYLFLVEDTGIGIEKENIEKLFIPFEQLDNSLTKSYEGTGLGLSICDNLLRQMGSSFEVNSQIEKGTKFTFRIRFERATPIVDEFPIVDKEECLRSEAKILLVEDNEINAEIAGALLNEIGIDYDWAENGEKAIWLCEKKSSNYYRLILMDIQMPGMNGYSVAETLKTKYGIVTPVIALTAGLIDKELLEDESNNMRDYILKPFNVVQFKKKIMEYL